LGAAHGSAKSGWLAHNLRKIGDDAYRVSIMGIDVVKQKDTETPWETNRNIDELVVLCQVIRKMSIKGL